MYKMAIFDLDGTLLNTLEDLADAGNYALSQLGFPIHDTEKYKYFVGNGIPKLIKRILPEEHKAISHKKAHAIFSSYYNLHMNDKTHPYDDIIEMLNKLKKNNIITVVVTNKSAEFADLIVRNYFGNLIDSTYGSIEGYPKKPDPYWVNKAINDYGIDRENIIYVGDSGVDMGTARNAGLFSCGVTWGFRTKDELLNCGAEIICNNCIDLLECILNN